jgi:protein-disulfide isomerase
MTALLRRVSTSVLAGLILAMVPAVIGWHVAAAQVPAASPQTPPNVTAEFLRQYQAAPRMTVPVMSGGATVVIVKFTDYQCPACAMTHQLYKPVLDKYEAQFPGAVKMIVKNYPLDRSCNPSLAQPLHTASCAAAVAVTLARAEKQDVQMEDWLYSNQQLLTPDTVRKAAELVGNVRDFSGGYARAIEQVKADVGLGRLLDVNSTPTFFINGVKIAQVLQPDLFDAAIAFELRKAGKLK